MKLENLEKFYKIHSGFYDFTRQFFLFNREKAIDSLDIKAGETVIDFACGTGLNIPFILKRTSPDRVTGIDYSPSMLQEARKKFPNVKFIEGDVSAYRFPHKADKIICTYSLSMVDNWEKALVNMKETLKPGGTLVILDFHRWQGLIKIFYPLFKYWLKEHGVNPEQKITEFLKNHFASVEEKILLSGYNFIVIAKSPR